MAYGYIGESLESRHRPGLDERQITDAHADYYTRLANRAARRGAIAPEEAPAPQYVAVACGELATVAAVELAPQLDVVVAA